MDLKEQLAHLQERLAELESAARKLPNQNFADLIKSAHGRLAQAADHPDLDAVGAQLETDLDDGQPKFPFDMNGNLPRDADKKD